MSKLSKNRLGRGLTSLIGTEYNNVDNFIVPSDGNLEQNKIFHMNLNDIVRNNENPRYNFDKSEIISLADSIKEHGVLQPIIVKPHMDNKYMIIAGERRWRASKEAGLSTIPVLIKDINEKKALELAIIENIQRADLNAIEESLGYKQLIEFYGYSQEEVAQKVGFSRSRITNMLRLLSLPEDVKQLLEEKKLTVGHVRCLINRPDAVSLAYKAVNKQWSVRQLEEQIKAPKTEKSPKTPGLDELEKNLCNLIKLDVKIKKQKEGGQLIIKYKNEEELLVFLEKIKN